MQDVDGVAPHSVLMAVTKFHHEFPPAHSHVLIAGLGGKPPVPTTLQPGDVLQQGVEASMHWESCVRYMDEQFMKAQSCLAVEGGRADLQLQCMGAPCISTAPFAITIGFAPRGMSMWKRRACHVPVVCNAAARDLFTDGCAGHRCQSYGSARVSIDGNLSLTSASDKEAQEAGAIFATAVQESLLDGFYSTFKLEMKRSCHTHFPWQSCPQLSGGLAFVLMPQDAVSGGKPVGGTCEVEAYIIEANNSGPAVPGLVMTNTTHIACAGYSSLAPSIGVVFSLPAGRTENRYWMVDAPIVKALSDWSRCRYAPTRCVP